MSRRLRTAVSGLGRIGWQCHLPNVARHDGFDAVGVLDPVAERRQEAKAEYGVDGFADFERMLDVTEPELLVIAAPTHFHADQAISAMERGIDVFCDKPLAPNLAETDRIIDAMKRTGRKLMVYQPHRATNLAVGAKTLLDRGLVGPVYMMKRTCSMFTRRNDWQAWKKYGGGILNNYGAHYIDQLLHVVGEKVTHVSAQMRSVVSLGDADDVVKAVLETESGVILDFDITMACAFKLPQWVMLGEHGSISFDADENAFLVHYFDPAELAAVVADDGLAAADRKYGNAETIPWHKESFPIADFTPIVFYDKVYDYYACDAAPFVPIQETREVLRVMAACRSDSGWE